MLHGNEFAYKEKKNICDGLITVVGIYASIYLLTAIIFINHWKKKVVELHGFTNQNYVIYYIIMKFYVHCHQTNNS
jgi:hypothetical protein